MPETIALHDKIATARDSIVKLAALDAGQGHLDGAHVPAICLKPVNVD
jgi:hypothetical protein